jgi:hypothetical protein
MSQIIADLFKNYAEKAQELRPDLAGYPSVDHLVQGYRASSEEAKKWRDRALQLEQQAPRQDIPQRQSNPYDRLRDYGIPPEDLQEAVNMEIKKAFEPLARGFQARGQVVGKYQDYAKFEADVAQYIGADPELSDRYQRMFNADPAGAMEFAFLNAILRSDAFPPHDPWLSGFGISYYYFGYVMMAVMTYL